MALDESKAEKESPSWLDARQRALAIVKTTTTPGGGIIDWIRPESQLPSGKLASPPPSSALPVRVDDARRPVKPVKFELDSPGIERGPAGTVPVLRPRLPPAKTEAQFKEVLLKRGGLKVYKNRPGRTSDQPTDPNPAGYFHAIDNQSTTLYGCDFFANVWDPEIDLPSSPGDDHSILQVWLQNNKPPLQSIEGGWTIDQNLNGDLKPHLFIYYTTNGYSANGDNQGGYNRVYQGFVQYSSAVFPGALIAPSSLFDGAQYDISMKFQLYREPSNGELNWWINVQGEWMGYYPASLFNGGLGNNATYAGFGGEVYSSLANPATSKDQMGSGWEAQAGWTRAAFMRNIRIQSDLNGTMANNKGTPSSDTATGSGPNPYDIVLDMDSGSTWASYLYVGGPTAAISLRDPAALYATGANNQQHVFCQGSDNGIYNVFYDPGDNRIHGPESWAQNAAGGPATLYATGANNQQHVFYRGVDGGIYNVFYDPGDNKIHGPERWAQNAAGDPAALYATGANNQQHVFYRGVDGGIYNVFYDPGDNKIHGPERWAQNATGRPATLYATGANNQQHVFYRGVDGGIYNVFYDPGDNKIHGPERWAQNAAGDPAALYATGANNQQHVFYRGVDGGIYNVFYDPGDNKIHGPERWAQNAAGDPAALYATGANNQQHVFYRGVDGGIYNVFYDPGDNKINGPERWAQNAAGDPATLYATGANNQQHVFYQGVDGVIYNIFYDPGDNKIHGPEPWA